MSACVPTTTCTSGQFEVVSATSSRDRVCQNYTTCPDGYWKQGWSATADGTCTACATCATGFSAVQLCTQFQNRICVNTVCDSSTDCGSLFCNYSSSLIACNLQWNTPGLSNVYLCSRATTTGVCTSCPVGWTASGGYCEPCPRGASCDALGVVHPNCGGTCQAGKQTRCNAVTGRVDCSSACPVNSTAAALGNYQVYRGGVIDRPDMCDAYFKCNVGYYASSTGLDSQGVSYPLCLPCQTQWATGGPYAAVTAGMSYGDPYSCLFDLQRILPSANPVGTFGTAAPFTPCPSGTTSDAGMALNVSGCKPCKFVPPNAIVDPLSTRCSFLCAANFTQLGHACVNPMSVPCTDSGYFLSAQGSQGQVCDVSPLPWNGLGNASTGAVWVSRQTLNMRVVSYDASARVGTNGTQIFTGADWTPLCRRLYAYPTYVQDVPLTALTCEQIEYHRFYLVTQGGEMLLAFLERSFGFFHRFVLWGVNTRGEVVLRWMLPGKVCSATTSVIAGTEYLYMHFCNTHFVSFLQITNNRWGQVQYRETNNVYLASLGFNATVLIGGQVAGKADGLRDTALFGSSLSLAVGDDPSRLFVADRDNCRIAEVWIDTPGSFTTSARTVRASCYDAADGIPFPRLLTSVLGGKFLLFVTDLGLFQMDMLLRSFSLIVDADVLPADPIALGADADHVWVWNATTNTTIRDDQQLCPTSMSSLPGRSCSNCASGQFVAQDTRLCMDCTHVPWCPPGTLLQNCNDTHDAFCYPCANPPSYNFSYISGCTTVMLPPCQPGWYGVSNCTPCPPFSTTSSVGAQTVAACSCQYGGTMNTTTHTCATPSPFAGALGPAYDIAQLPPWLESLGCRNTGGATCSQCRGSIDSTCLPCGANGLYLQSVTPRICITCPGGKVGLNGLWCQSCPALQAPNPQGTACLCKPNAVVGPDGVSCICSAGYEEISGNCLPCQPGFFAAGPGHQCSRCPPGSESAAASTQCSPCPSGLYQDGTTTLLCTECRDPGEYALDSTSAASCSPCQESCPAGTSHVPCTGTGWACPPCNNTLDPQSQHWVTGTGYPDCLWGCNQGYYLSQGACRPCTPLESCPAGFALEGCSAYTDANCDTQCSNDTKPVGNAVWGERCSWVCMEGYTLVTKSFLGWTEYACESAEKQLWWSSWLFY